MKRVKSTPGTVVFKSKKHHISFAFGIGKHWGATFGAEYYESWDWHHFVIGFTIIKFLLHSKLIGESSEKTMTETKCILKCTTERRKYGR